MSSRSIDVTILICTRNRDRLLGETLDSLAQLHVPERWRCEVLIVDNGSIDRTREAVLDRVATFALPLRYLQEAAGKIERDERRHRRLERRNPRVHR